MKKRGDADGDMLTADGPVNGRRSGKKERNLRAEQSKEEKRPPADGCEVTLVQLRGQRGLQLSGGEEEEEEEEEGSVRRSRSTVTGNNHHRNGLRCA